MRNALTTHTPSSATDSGMWTNRRGFMHVLAGTAAWLAGAKARAAEPVWTSEIHQRTRNTWLGPVGRQWWPVGRKTRRTKPKSGEPPFFHKQPGYLYRTVRFFTVSFDRPGFDCGADYNQ